MADVSHYSHEKLLEYAENMGTWASQLELMCKDMYYEFVQGTNYEKWYQERLAEMDVFVKTRQETEADSFDEGAVWDYYERMNA